MMALDVESPFLAHNLFPLWASHFFDFACPRHAHLRGHRLTHKSAPTLTHRHTQGQTHDPLQPDLICSLGGEKPLKKMTGKFLR